MSIMDDMDQDIGQALERLARSQPTAPAIHAPGRTSLTYAGLGAQIRYVRERLNSWGIVRGDVIAAVIPSRPEMAVALATVPPAATFAPLNPAFTTDVYCELLARLRPKALLVPTDFDHPVRLAARHCSLAEIELVPDPAAPAGMFTLELARQQESLNRVATSRPDWAYLVTTSGTTGRPKIVPISHRRLSLYAQSQGDWLQLTANDVACLMMPLHTGAARISPLLRGVSFACLPEYDIDGFFHALDEYRVTWFNASPTFQRAILRRAADYREAVARNKLRFITVGAGRLEPEEIDRIERTFGVPLLVFFGMTEASVVTRNPPPPRMRKRGSVGVPSCNQVAVMGDEGALCAAGDVGEVVVRGPLVFDGYFHDAQATAAAFVDGWFRTGDLGRFDEDGYLYLVGRIKELINRGGEKISPVEIDAAITAIPGVRAAAAFAISHRTLGEEVVAAVVKNGDVAITESDIIDQVRRRMGPTRVPRHIYFVDQLPRTDSGKVRRSELPRLLGLDQPGVEPALEAPATALSELEAALADRWSTILQIKSVGANDDFFLLGGDSLRGARLLTSVKAVFGVDLTIQELFGKAATVAGMARAIEHARAGGTTDRRVPDAPARTGTTIPRRQERGPAILSDTQKRMWFLARLDPGNVAYNQSRAFRLTGAIDVEALRRALRFVTGRHEILRTTYSFVDDEPRPIVHDDDFIDLQITDLAAIPGAQQNEVTERLLLDGAQRVFDLETDPTLRLLLVRLSEREHVLLRVIHHIASDGWSSGIFERELSAAYGAYVKGREPALPALPIQYADYALWQREWLQGELLERQFGYWKSKLADLPTLVLPTDRPRPPVLSYRGAHAAFDLAAPLMQGLKALAQREGATLFMTLLAAFQVLLYRYSGEEDIAVGAPIAGRRRSELEPLIGFFANTLVLRVDLSGNPEFRELLARVRESALGAYTHQDLPFEKLVEELAPARDLSRNPLFQVTFALQNAPDSTLALEHVQVSRLERAWHSAKFDLSLGVRETPAGLRVSWEFSTDLFDPSTIERMHRHFQRVLEAIVADSQQRIGQLPLLTEAERHQLLVAWNDTAADYPHDRCIHELFEEQAARMPGAVAVVFDQQLTYGELNARANQLAHHLIGLEVGPEVLVGICMERSLELIVGLLGILKAGGAYVPLDPSYPAKRLEFMLKDTAAPVLLTQQGLLSRLPQFEGCILCLDRDWPAISAHSAANPATNTAAEVLAYVMYTSGSTGKPKGVMTEHKGVVRLVKGADYVSLNAADTLLHLAPLSFDASTFELWGALLNGGRVVLLPPGQPALAEIGKAIREHRVTTLWLSAGLFHLMVDERLDDLKPLRQLLAGGDVLSAEHLVKARRALPGCRLINGYGPTENTTFTCCYTVAAERELMPTVPVGRPIANTRVYVLDSRLQPVPVGVTGELYVSGDGVARGYLNRPALTAEKFLPDPFSEVPGARMYRTGDLMRYRPDGNIEFLGRIDDQLKIRGFRIELGEIQAVLTEHSAVRQAVVLACEDVPGSKRLVAYVVPADASFADTEQLRAFMRERLPQYMLPSALVLLERLPLTPNGKIDRQALSVPSAALEGVPPQAAPRDRVEQTLCTVWEETLGVKGVSLDDNFFELGGHSLLAASLFARLDRVFDRLLPLATLFEAPTVRGLARFYREGTEPANNSALVPITSGGSLPPVFAVPGVSGNVLCYADLAQELGPEQPFYGLPSVGLDGAREPLESIQEMAAQCLAEIRQLQPRGPYYLVGACFGAIVAFEMAHQLVDAGEPVAFLGLVDPSNIGSKVTDRRTLRLPRILKRGVALGRFVFDRARLYRNEMRTLGFRDKLGLVHRKAKILKEATQQRDLFRGDRREFFQRRVHDANLGALHRYKRKPLRVVPGTFSVFATDRLFVRPSSSVSSVWDPLAGGSVAYHRVPGKDSGDMLQGENAKALAGIFAIQLLHARRTSVTAGITYTAATRDHLGTSQ